MKELPVFDNRTCATTWLEGGRRHGITTILVDIAIMNARTGAKVQFWNRSWSEADHSARVACDRLQVTDTAPTGIRFVQPNGVRTLEFPNGGRIQFRGIDSFCSGDFDKPGIDFNLFDVNGRGKVVRHHADVRYR